MADIIGTALPDHLIGTPDSDLILGLDGNDTLNGGNGNDTASYENSFAAVSVNLESGFSDGGDATGDVLSNIALRAAQARISCLGRKGTIFFTAKRAMIFSMVGMATTP